MQENGQGGLMMPPAMGGDSTGVNKNGGDVT